MSIIIAAVDVFGVETLHHFGVRAQANHAWRAATDTGRDPSGVWLYRLAWREDGIEKRCLTAHFFNQRRMAA